jgi:hypothetical protein
VRTPQIVKGEECARGEPEAPAEYSAFIPVKDGIWETISNFYEPFQFGDLVFGMSDITISSLDFPRAKYNWGDVFEPSKFGWNPLKIEVEAGQLQNLRVDLSVESQKGKLWEQDGNYEINNRTINVKYFVPDHRENKLSFVISDPVSGKQLYETSYILTVPPFIEYNLESIYSRSSNDLGQIDYKLNMDDSTIKSTYLVLSIYEKGKKYHLLEKEILDPGQKAAENEYLLTKDIKQFAPADFTILATLLDKRSDEIIATSFQPFTLPNFNSPSFFYADRGPYSFGGIQDDAITIHYPDGEKFVFWRGANYGPWWDIDQRRKMMVN